VDLAVISDQTFYGIDREFLDTLRDNGLDLRIIPKDHDIIDELNCLVSPVAVIFVFDYVVHELKGLFAFQNSLLQYDPMIEDIVELRSKGREVSATR